MLQTKKKEEDILLKVRADRRLLSHVPDKEKIRSNTDRRGKSNIDESITNIQEFIKKKEEGIRYEVEYNVSVKCTTKSGIHYKFTCKSCDISATGIGLIVDKEHEEILEDSKRIFIKFQILPGTMPEGFEMKVKTKAIVVRTADLGDGGLLCGLQFEKTLAQYVNRKKDSYLLVISSIILFCVTLFIVLMRVESVLYFKFNRWLYLYSIIAAIFLLSRYLFGACYKSIPIDVNFTPGVTIIIPCFNEEEWIQRTILSCINQDYPIDKLEVIVVDDCSNDHSVEKINEIIDKLYNEAERYQTKDRLKCFVQEQNLGKRDALVRGVEEAKHELVVFVDSDSFLDPFAIRNLVQPFKDPKMGGVAGRTDVANTFTNSLTKMQSVRYYIAFRIMKAAEAYFDAVTCLSGPLSCYKKEIILKHKEEWLNQHFLGQKATFGDDRAMTNFVLRHHRTSYQDTAVCSTIVPNKYPVFLKQQMRWKRSWLRESLIAGKFMWRKEPFMAVFFYMGLIVPIAAPIVVVYNLIYVPITHHVFPTTFLVGILMMSLLMSFAQLLLRKSSTWLFGFLFCIFYEAVLLWQMPIAWFTFWKSTWGTRMTPKDIEAKEKKEKKRQKKEMRKLQKKRVQPEMESEDSLLVTSQEAAATTEQITEIETAKPAVAAVKSAAFDKQTKEKNADKKEGVIEKKFSKEEKVQMIAEIVKTEYTVISYPNSAIFYHFICPVKYELLKESIDKIDSIIIEICKEIEYRFEYCFYEIGSTKSEIHFLVEAEQVESPYEIINKIRTIISKQLEQKIPEISTELWGTQLWKKNFYINTVTASEKETAVIRYVKQIGLEGEYKKLN